MSATERLREIMRTSINPQSIKECSAEVLTEAEHLRAALRKIIAANDEFRKSLPPDWDGDPVNDACEEARGLIA